MSYLDPFSVIYRRFLDTLKERINTRYRYERERSEVSASDMDPAFWQIYESCRDYTMTSLPRMYSLYEATKYVSENGVPGDIVECGVWKGGSMMLVCKTLLHLSRCDKRIFLYDTFEGMSRPTERDVRSLTGERAMDVWNCHQNGAVCNWAYCALDETKNNLLSTGYDQDRFVFVKGRVEETLPGTIPEKISILRLDTDFYESTLHELHHLFPRLECGGILAIDDYGSYEGCRCAVDEYFHRNGIKIFLNRIDGSGYRIGVKT
jgi:hypothetical protein